jgi:outer membrane receptor protein involved in Fe transport
VNGRRHIASNVLGNAVEVDTNTIPTDLIERVDVVTGGNSAIYGSDSIAGVVNFVLKQDFEGLQVRGQGGISKYGDAGNYYVSALGGMNFADGRGYAAFLTSFFRPDHLTMDQLGRLAQDALYYHEGPTEPAPPELPHYSRQMSITAGIR